MGHEPVVLIVRYHQGYLSCALWDSDYKMTDEARGFMRGFLLGAGIFEYSPDYDGLPIM